MQDPIIVNVLSYWERLRAGRLAPMRSELDPRQITGALDHVFMLEYNGPLDVRFRLAGMSLCEMMGMELRGMPARTLIDIGHRDELSRILDDLTAAPKIVELVLQTPSDQPPVLTSRMLLLPLQNDAGAFTRILGCMVFSGTNLQTPRRFEIAKVKTTRIIGTMDRPSPTLATGFTEDRANFHSLGKMTKSQSNKTATTPQSVTGKPYLRLVKGG